MTTRAPATPGLVSSPMERTDIFISGGGLAGLIAAAAFGRAGFSVVLADPAPPVSDEGSTGSDLRSTAYLQPAKALLERAGLWAALEPVATPLEALRIVDSTGWPPEVREDCTFHPGDVGDAPFGWNLLNWQTRKSLSEQIAELPRVSLRFGTGFRGLLQRDGEAIITLTGGARVAARLCLAADGRASPLREAAGIACDTQRYGQKALAFTATHEAPHNNVSTELYNTGGAFTLVPMPDHEGAHMSAVVWMDRGPDTEARRDAPPEDFNTELTLRSCAVLGGLQVASPRQAFPVLSQRARQLTLGRVALIAEAAHVMPPIGAQGLNTSLMDVASLLDLALSAPETLGSPAMLDAFARARNPDIQARMRAIDLFNRVCLSGAAPVQELRRAGLRLVHGVAPVRQAVMQAGLNHNA